MAEATGLRNNALPYPIYGAPFGIAFPYLDADGDLVSAATTPDTEVSLNGDTFADCTNEATEIATNSGMWYLLLTAAEMTADVVAIISKSATSGMKTTPIVLYPRKLVTIRSGTAAGGAAGYITLDGSASALDDTYNGMVCIATIDTNVEVRVISDYTGSNQQAAVVPNWNVVPDIDDTFIIKLPEGVQGAGLAAIPWNATWDAEVQSEVDDALVANNLDHLALTATAGADMTTEVADNTILSRIIGNGDTSTFVPSTDGLRAAGVDLDAILLDTGTTLETDLDAIIAAVITNAAGVDIAADIIAVKADTAAILTDTGTTLEADLDAIIAAVITNAAGVDIAADIIAVKADTAAILVDTGTTLEADLDAILADTVELTGIIADSVPVDGTRPTPAQALYMIWQFLAERSVSGTTVTVKKADGSTSLMTFTLNDGTTPTSITRAT